MSVSLLARTGMRPGDSPFVDGAMSTRTSNTRRKRSASEDSTSGKTPLSSGDSFDRPKETEPGIRLRGHGRQVLISTGRDLSPDHDLETEEGEADPDGREGEANSQPSKRGNITGFSEKSRRRLRERVHAIRRDTVGVFLTLTYHRTDPTPEKLKEDFRAFWKLLQRTYNREHVSNLSCVWKMEPQERGTPHIHMIVYGVSYIDAQTVSKVWHGVTEETSEKHRKAGVDVQTAVNENGKLQAYLSKYMAEVYDGWPGAEEGDPWAETGRWWGFKGRDYLPVAEWEETQVKLHQKEAEDLIEELLGEWGVDMPEGVIPPTLVINTRGDPGERLLDLIDRI